MSIKRIYSIILTLTILVTGVISIPVSASTSSYGIVTADVLNIRAEASTTSKILGQVTQGYYVDISWLEPGWARITYNDINGYCSSDYITVCEGPKPAGVRAEILPNTVSRSGAVSSKGQAIAERAKDFLGVPYVYGGTSAKGFDCSGFVYFLYKEMGVTLNRVAAGQMTNGKWVSLDEIQPGDIVGFKNSNGYVNHVGIYVGNGMMIHAPQTGDVVKYTSIVEGNYAGRIAGVRRIFD